MKKKLTYYKYLFYSFSAIIFLSLTNPVYAETSPPLTRSRGLTQLPPDLKPIYLPNIDGYLPEDKIYNLAGSIIITIMQFAGGIAVILLIINGFRYIMARGDGGEAGKVKTNIMWIAAGLILGTIAYVVIRFTVKFALSIDEFNE